jgi:hypothetical protein
MRPSPSYLRGGGREGRLEEAVHAADLPDVVLELLAKLVQYVGSHHADLALAVGDQVQLLLDVAADLSWGVGTRHY